MTETRRDKTPMNVHTVIRDHASLEHTLCRALEAMIDTALATADEAWVNAIGRAGTNRPIDEACRALAMAYRTTPEQVVEQSRARRQAKVS
jgi:hypothetical protein